MQTAVASNAEATDSFASPQLLAFVFERLGPEARNRAEKSASTFLEADLNANVYASVFTIDQSLRLLQPFTNDLKKLRQAVHRAGSGAFSRYEAQTERMQEDLVKSVASLQAVSDETNPVVLKMAQVTLSMIEAADRLDRQQHSHAAITGLTALVEGQKELQGRKTVIYFSEGMSLPANKIEAFRSVLSAANLAQISFYAVDAHGLVTTSDLDRSRTLLQNAADASLRGQRNNQISPDEMRAMDTAHESIRAGQQGSLA